jgi:hypothetical protein
LSTAPIPDRSSLSLSGRGPPRFSRLWEPRCRCTRMKIRY